MSLEQTTFLCHGGEVLVFQVYKGNAEGFEKPANRCAVHVKRMVFDKETTAFVLKSTAFFSFKEKATKIKIVCCSCVADSRTGLNIPCILIERKTCSSVFKYYLLLFFHPDKFKKRLTFKLNYELDEDVKIFDGPLIFWYHNSTFFYASYQIKKVFTLSVKFTSIEWVGEVRDFGVFLLGRIHHSSVEAECMPEVSEADFESLNTKFCACALENQELFISSSIIPVAYSSVVTRVHVCTSEMINNELRMSLVVLTQKNQLISFENGTLKSVCHLPFLDPYALQFLDLGKGNNFFIVSFRSNDVCAVSEKNFQVVAKWNKISLVLINDLIEAGTEQVLLLLENSLSPDWLTAFKITDLDRINYSSNPLDCHKVTAAEADEHNQHEPHSPDVMIPFLETKVKTTSWTGEVKSCRVQPYPGKRNLRPHRQIQYKCARQMGQRPGIVALEGGEGEAPEQRDEETNVTLVEGLKQQLLIKDKLIEKSCSALSNSLQRKDDNTTSQEEEDHLVSLCGEEKDCAQTSDAKLPDNSDNLQDPHYVVKKTWYRVLDDYLIVGVKVTSLIPSPDDMTISLIMDKGNSNFQLIKCQNKVLSLDSDSFPGSYLMSRETEPERKRIKLTPESKKKESCSDERSSKNKSESVKIITAVTPLSPFLALNNFNCIMLLQTSKKGKDKRAADRTIHCNRLTLPIQDLLSNKYLLKFSKEKPIENAEDLFSLLAVLEKSSFQVSSPPSTVNLMKEWLLENLKCEVVKQCPQVYFYKEPGHFGALFYWEQRTELEGVLTIHCRTQRNLFQCLQNLITVMPVNCYFKHLKFGSENFHIDELAAALERELITLGSLSTSAIQNIKNRFVENFETKSSAVTASCDADSNTRQHGGEAEGEGVVMDISSSAISGNVYAEITLIMSEVMLNSDLAAKRLEESL